MKIEILPDIADPLDFNRDYKGTSLFIDDVLHMYIIYYHTVLTTLVNAKTFYALSIPVVLELDKNNPASTIERFYKLMVLK